ncbi:MAG: hypothetical protein NTV56_13915 [Alphaproteobacteria bacterium]|nr:hypothetical protein [Alphaproteobacteria bacterium]
MSRFISTNVAAVIRLATSSSVHSKRARLCWALFFYAGTKGAAGAWSGMTDNEASGRGEARPDLNDELDRLQERMPHPVARVMKKVRSPEAKPYRIPIGVVLTAGGVVGFLPILGFWMVPLGLAVIAQDVPVMRPPLARGIAWINRNWKPSA